MGTHRATVIVLDDKHYIKIEVGQEEIKIPMSEDKPNEVKSAFNELISLLRNGKLQIELDDLGEDLFSQVANEYITQLNREIQEVFGEMVQYGLAIEGAPDSTEGNSPETESGR